MKWRLTYAARTVFHHGRRVIETRPGIATAGAHSLEGVAMIEAPRCSTRSLATEREFHL